VVNINNPDEVLVTNEVLASEILDYEAVHFTTLIENNNGTNNRHGSPIEAIEFVVSVQDTGN
jgi:hypothetical protein